MVTSVDLVKNRMATSVDLDETARDGIYTVCKGIYILVCRIERVNFCVRNLLNILTISVFDWNIISFLNVNKTGILLRL